MSPQDDEARLHDILDYAHRAVDAVRERSRSDLDRDVILAAALERFLEIIGEAASRLSEERKGLTPNVPWRQMVGMRNRLIHGYGAVDLDILWNVVRDDLPHLITILESELDE